MRSNNHLKEFEDLLDWFESKDKDPWFVEKYGSKTNQLSTMQSFLCPCELHNMYEADPVIDLKRTLCCMKRANFIRPHSARGTTFITDSESKEESIYFPPVHVDECTCKDIGSILSLPEKNRIIESYKKYYEEINKNIKPSGSGSGTCIIS
jgi:hypothetical protein